MNLLDKNITTINGYIMSANTPVVKIEDGEIKEINKKLAPLHFLSNKSVETWLEKRAIDSHRTNSRLLKKALRLENRDDLSTVLAVNAVTITDNYWFKSADENLTWDDVKFKENLFDNLALNGDPDGFSKEPSRTPELTNIGSFEKCWRLINNKWWLFKSGNDNQIFSELFIYYLGEELGFKMAHYEYDNGYIKTIDFTNNGEYNFEPISSVLNDNEDYNDNFEYFYKISFNMAEDYLKMIYLDSICYNMDRHTNNYGILRNSKTGDFVSLAPNFDNNIALISNGYPKNVLRNEDGLLKFLFEFFSKNHKAKEMFRKIKIPEITEKMVRNQINKIPIKVDDDFIVKFIINGQDQIKKELKINA